MFFLINRKAYKSFLELGEMGHDFIFFLVIRNIEVKIVSIKNVYFLLST